MKDDGSAAEREVLLAEQALGGGRFDVAEGHLARAKQLGMHEVALDRLAVAIRAARTRQTVRRNWSVPSGIGAAAVCYFILSIRQPLAWTIPLWSLLAFVVIPFATGSVTARMAGSGMASRSRSLAAAVAGAVSMAGYTGISLIVVHGRINSVTAPGASDAVVRVGFVVTITYAAIAGLVSGWAAAIAGRRIGAEERA